MGIIAWIVLGLGAGLLANMLIPGRRSQGLILTCVIGVAGALLGGWTGNQAVPRRHPARVLQHLHLADRHRRLGGPAAGLPPGHQPRKRRAHPPAVRLGAPVTGLIRLPRPARTQDLILRLLRLCREDGSARDSLPAERCLPCAPENYLLKIRESGENVVKSRMFLRTPAAAPPKNWRLQGRVRIFRYTQQ